MHENYIVPLNGLGSERKGFRWHVGKEFFSDFGNSEIRDCDVWVDAEAAKKGGRIDIDCRIDGSVVTVCDRCLGDLEVEIGTDLALTVRFGDEPESAPQEEDGREVVYVRTDNDSIEMDQVIYDYICLSIPLHKVHLEGGCDPEVLKFIKTESLEEGEKAPANNPFSALKGLLDKKL